MKKINGDNPRGILRRILYFYQCISDHKKGSDNFLDTYNPVLSISKTNTSNKTPWKI